MKITIKRSLKYYLTLFLISFCPLVVWASSTDNVISIDLVKLAKKIQANESTAAEEALLYNLTGMSIDIAQNPDFVDHVIELDGYDFGVHMIGNYYLANFHDDLILQQEVDAVFQQNPDGLIIECQFEKSSGKISFTTYFQSAQLSEPATVNSIVQSTINDYFQSQGSSLLYTIDACSKGLEALLFFLQNPDGLEGLVKITGEEYSKDASDSKIYLAPSGLPIRLPEDAKPHFASATDPPTFKGALMGFSWKGQLYGATYLPSDPSLFTGYRKEIADGNSAADYYSYDPPTIPAGVSPLLLGFVYDDCGSRNVIGLLYDNPVPVGNTNTPEYRKCLGTFQSDETIVNRLSNTSFGGETSLFPITHWESQYLCIPKPTELDLSKLGPFNIKYNPYGYQGIAFLHGNYPIYANFDNEGKILYYALRNDDEWVGWSPGEDCFRCEVVDAVVTIFTFDGNIHHIALDAAGAINPLGDLANAFFYWLEGDDTNVAISLAALLPIVDWQITGGKYALRIVDAATGNTSVAKGAGIIQRAADGSIVSRKSFDELTDYLNQKCGNPNGCDWVADFVSDFNSSKEFAEAVVERPELVEAWEALYPGIYRTNINALEFFSDPTVSFTKNSVVNSGLPALFPHIPVEELTAIRHYTTNAYRELNTALRNTPEPKHLGFEEMLNNGLSKLTPYNGGNVQRGVYGVEADIAKTWNPGDKITFKDFKSSSTDANVAYSFSIGRGGNVVYEISNPVAYDICNISCLPGEAEVLFKSKAQFKVTAVDENFTVIYNGTPTIIRKIYIEYLP